MLITGVYEVARKAKATDARKDALAYKLHGMIEEGITVVEGAA